MKYISLEINNNTDWSVAGHLFRKPKYSRYKISNAPPGVKSNTHLELRGMDKNKLERVKLIHTEDNIGTTGVSPSPRLIIKSNISIPNEEYVIKEFNRRIKELREEYCNLFMTIFMFIPFYVIRDTQAHSLIEQILKEYDETHTT